MNTELKKQIEHLQEMIKFEKIQTENFFVKEQVDGIIQKAF